MKSVLAAFNIDLHFVEVLHDFLRNHLMEVSCYFLSDFNMLWNVKKCSCN